MRIREPGVDRPQRDLNRKGDEESEEKPLGGGVETRNLRILNSIANRHVIKAARVRVKPDRRGEHEHRGDHGEEEELHGGIDTAAVTVNADDQRHRNKRGFPEEVEQEQIEGDEDANHRGLEYQHEDEEFLHPIVDRLPGDQHAQRRQKRGQHHQPH